MYAKLVRTQLLHRAILKGYGRTRATLLRHLSEELTTRGYKEISLESLQDDISDLRELGVTIKYTKASGYYTEPKFEWLDLEGIIDPLKILTSMDREAGTPDYLFPEKYETKGLQHLNPIINAIRER